jgi:Flp pilus assembly protein protease CpaA
MFGVVEIGLSIACGAWSASNLTHPGLIVLVILAPVIAWRDFSTHRIPESISLPWLSFALTIALFRLPASATALLATAITAGIICLMTLTGIINQKHFLGIADAIVLVAILATLCDDRTFPAPSIFVTMALTIVAAALVALAVNAFQRRPLSAPGPIGGSLAIGAVLVAIPTWLLAR